VAASTASESLYRGDDVAVTWQSRVSSALLALMMMLTAAAAAVVTSCSAYSSSAAFKLQPLRGCNGNNISSGSSFVIVTWLQLLALHDSNERKSTAYCHAATVSAVVVMQAFCRYA
jgi:hypothetical protein